MCLVLGVPVGVGLDADDRAAADLALRNGRDLGERVACERRLVAALPAPKRDGFGAAAGVFEGAVVEGVGVVGLVPVVPSAAVAMP